MICRKWTQLETYVAWKCNQFIKIGWLAPRDLRS